MGFVIMLILIGLVLIFTEILLIPGVGVAGILGILSLGGSCYYAFYELEPIVGYIVTSVNLALLIGLTVFALRSKTWKKLALETKIDSKAVDTDNVLALGDKGRTMTRLAPIGAMRFGNKVVEVKAVEGIIDAGVDVEVVLIEDNKIYVSPVKVM